MLSIKLEPVADGKVHNLYIVSQALNAAEAGTLILNAVQFKTAKGRTDIVKRK